MTLTNLTNRIGYYIGSFDPPTLAHRKAVLEAMRHFGLSKVYITVNHCTDKDFAASMTERIRMLRLLFADQGDRIVILREPLEGRREFARYILEKHPDAHLLGIFGEDTFDKNFRIFAGEPRFDFVRIARPVATECSAESAYVPVIYDIMLQDADGVSSSEARRRIALGLDTSNILSSEVASFIVGGGLYPSIAEHTLKAAEQRFLSRWRKFHSRLQGVISDSQRLSLSTPSFKAIQSKEGQSDKLVRHVVESVGMTLDDQFRLRPVMERYLQIGYPTRPITWRAGVYFGSFDPASDAQAIVASTALAQGTLNRLTIGVLSSSGTKTLKLPVAERLRRAKRVFGRFGESVCVVEAPGLEDSPTFVRHLRDEQLEPLLTVFGATVFPDNYKRLRDLDNLRYAVAPIEGEKMPELPDGAVLLDLSRSPR